jgi:hypothetical protein
MKVYHGGYTEITTIEYWAKRRGRQHETEGVIAEFDFYEMYFNDLLFKTIRFETYSEEWLDFIVLNRDRSLPNPTHSYDFVEGPVANDNIIDRLTIYLNGEISKTQFLEELKFQKETHQICFCTSRSLLCLEPAIHRYPYALKQTNRNIITALMFDRKIEMETAADILYTSRTFAELAEPDSGLLKKPWQEIYELVKKELGNS